jgi:3-dehydrosphinganine reductase
MFGQIKWDPKDKVRPILAPVEDGTSNFLQHCYVTGGSSGSGLALAILLTKKRAHVSIVARDEGKLESALNAMEVMWCGTAVSMHG